MAYTKTLLTFTIFILGLLAYSSTAFAATYGAVASGNTCTGVDVLPTQNINSVFANNPAGTTFCIQDGTHVVTGVQGEGVDVQTGDRVVGEYSDTSFPVITTGEGQAMNIFDTTGSDSSYFEDVKITNAQYFDTELHICDPDPNCGRGIRGDGDVTVVNSSFKDNENNGISMAGDGNDLIVNNSTFNNNGNADSARDVPTEDPVSAAGIKLTQGAVLTFRNGLVINQYWDGLWCDVQCGGMNVYDSKITNNFRGLHYEISFGPGEIANNIIQNNGLSSPVNPSTPAGLLLQNSQDVNVHHNTFGGNKDYAAYFANSTARTPQMARTTFHDNTLNGDPVKGCTTTTGLTCSNNN